MTDPISATLREHADGDIHIERLLAAVHSGARRRRRQRLAVTVAVSAVVAVVALAGGFALYGIRGAPDRSADPTAGGAIPRPPVVTTVIPTSPWGDPTLFHLDLTGLDGWSELRWRAQPGYERLSGTAVEAGGDLFVEAAPSRDRLTGEPQETGPATVNGLPAEAVRIRPDTQDLVPGAGAPLSAVRWEAAPGVWVQVVVPHGPRAALTIAGRVRLDRTFRCAVPFRLVGLGDQARVVTCETWFTRHKASGGAHLHDGERPVEFSVTVGGADPVPPTTETIGGRAVGSVMPGRRMPGEGGPARAPYLVYPYEGGPAFFHAYLTTLDDPFLRSLVPAFQPVTDPDPAAWPRSPLG